MQTKIGWQAHVSDILAAGTAARTIAPYDERARKTEVERQIADARKFPWWPAIVAFFGFLAPHGWIVSVGLLLLFAGLIHRAFRRADELASQLREETARLRAAHYAEIQHHESVLRAANQGNLDALRVLLARWSTLRPDCIRRCRLELSSRPSIANGGGGTRPAFELRGRGIQRSDIPAGIPRVGRGGRTVLDKRKAVDIDEDLAEVNAAAVLSVLIALFSGPDLQAVAVRILIDNPSTGQPVPWVTHAGAVCAKKLLAVCDPMSSAAEAIRQLGGDVGRCRNQRLTAAKEPSSSLPVTALTQQSPTPGSAGSGDDPYGASAAPVQLGDAAALAQAENRKIPPAPAQIASSVGLSSAIPSPANVRGQFSAIARKFATYPGDPTARFVAFQAYYSTYADMAPGQLKFYFKWRNAARQGETPRTDLSYVFVHVYELLHVVGARDAADACAQLERVWTSYRPTHPKLDAYLVHWITDLYATQIGTPAALEFIQRAAAFGALTGPDEAMIVADSYWQATNYRAMPSASVALLVGDPGLGKNKFYVEHNGAEDGGWVDRAYRQALAVTDDYWVHTYGRTLREQTMRVRGLRTISRSAFSGAVYDWNRKQVVLGKVPDLTGPAPAVMIYRNAVRYAENLLRRERGFAAKLRGVELEPGLAAALDAHFAAYIRATKARARVTIDVAKAIDLARQSADVRARLLDGLPAAEEGEPTGTAKTPPAAPAPEASVAGQERVPAEYLASGLLTDVSAIRSALNRVSSPARALVRALADYSWELPESSPETLNATGGALIGPLVDEINERTLETLGDMLIVIEANTLVVQEDFRDEVHWILHGSLDGFDAEHAPEYNANRSDTADIPSRSPRTADADGFGPGELRGLALLAAGGLDLATDFANEAATQATTPLLLADRINECALSSSYGDILLDADQSPPAVLGDAQAYVSDLLKRVGAVVASPITSDPDDATVPV